jgi:hypothetical protein
MSDHKSPDHWRKRAEEARALAVGMTLFFAALGTVSCQSQSDELMPSPKGEKRPAAVIPAGEKA